MRRQLNILASILMLVTMPSGILQAQQHRTIRYSKASDAPKAYDVLTGLKQLYTYDDYGNVQDATANMHNNHS